MICGTTLVGPYRTLSCGCAVTHPAVYAGIRLGYSAFAFGLALGGPFADLHFRRVLIIPRSL